eukprot:UN01996
MTIIMKKIGEIMVHKIILTYVIKKVEIKLLLGLIQCFIMMIHFFIRMTIKIQSILIVVIMTFRMEEIFKNLTIEIIITVEIKTTITEDALLEMMKIVMTIMYMIIKEINRTVMVVTDRIIKEIITTTIIGTKAIETMIVEMKEEIGMIITIIVEEVMTTRRTKIIEKVITRITKEKRGPQKLLGLIQVFILIILTMKVHTMIILEIIIVIINTEIIITTTIENKTEGKVAIMKNGLTVLILPKRKKGGGNTMKSIIINQTKIIWIIVIEQNMI